MKNTVATFQSMKENGENISFTSKGFLVSNIILSELID